MLAPSLRRLFPIPDIGPQPANPGPQPVAATTPNLENENLPITSGIIWDNHSLSDRDRNFLLNVLEQTPFRKRGRYTTVSHLYKRDVRLAPVWSPEEQQQRDILERIFGALAIPRLPRGYITALARRHNLNRRTLNDWHVMLIKDQTWRPNPSVHLIARNRAFTDVEEAELMRRIKTNYLDHGLFYSDQDFKEDAVRYYAEILRNDVRTTDEQIERMRLQDVPEAVIQQRISDPAATRNMHFVCSPSFIRGFRRRYRMSLRRPNMKRRPPVSPEKIAEFKLRVEALKQHFSPDLILNMDETNFRLVNMKHLTWAVTGSKAVNCYNEEDLKAGVTVLATISMSGDKLPLMLVGKGTTQGALRKYGENVRTGKCWTSLSESGWSRENVICDYLDRLAERFPIGENDKRCALIMDIYAAHRTDAVRDKARELKIDLEFVPPGCTDQCQPLDVAVFAVLKAYAKALWRKQYHENHGAKIGWATVTEHLLESWERIDRSIVEKAWYALEEDYATFEDDDEVITLDPLFRPDLLSLIDF